MNRCVMNKLDVVSIDKTFRIKADSSASAAKIMAESSFCCRENVTAVVTHDDDSVFIVRSTIGDSVYYDVVYVERVGNGKYRVESGSVKLSTVEYTYLIGGDDAVNEDEFYYNKAGEIVSGDVYRKDLQFWVDDNIKEGTPGRMESYVRGCYSRAKMVNGSFIKV